MPCIGITMLPQSDSDVLELLTLKRMLRHVERYRDTYKTAEASDTVTILNAMIANCERRNQTDSLFIEDPSLAAGELRGLGHPRAGFVRELHIDEVADAIITDPVE